MLFPHLHTGPVMGPDDSDVLTDASSPISFFSTSPSPPPELSIPHVSNYPSPMSLKGRSHSGTPTPESLDSSAVSSDKDGDGPRPAKRRRISDRNSRSTEYLDLRQPFIKPEEQAQLDKLMTVLRKRRKIVVVAGAGMSVSAGIPDFRSSTGLFTTLKSEHNIKGGSGKQLFDASVYKDDSSTSSFHDMVRNMSKLTKNAEPTPFHHMLATLAQEGRLLRLYTQNVDGLDTSLEPLSTVVPLRKTAGKWPTTVQLHGSLEKMVCTKCGELDPFDPDLFDGPTPPACRVCVEQDHIRTTVVGKRSHGVGCLRPRMVLYQEHNPDDEAIGAVTKEDLRKRPDAIIVVGTSLKVPGVKRIVREMCGVVRDRRDGVAIWINNDPAPVGKEDCWDIVIRGTCDEVARHANMRRWHDVDEPMFTEDQWKEAQKCEEAGRIVVNASFKPVAATERWRRPQAQSPEYSPLAARVLSVAQIEASFTDEESLVEGAPPTPSRSNRSSPSIKEQSAFDMMKEKKAVKGSAGKSLAATTLKKATAAKAAGSGGLARKPSKKATVAKKPVTQQRINQTMKQKKAVPASADTIKVAQKADGRAIKSSPKRKSLSKAASVASTDDIMRPVSPEDFRVNAMPATYPTFCS